MFAAWTMGAAVRSPPAPCSPPPLQLAPFPLCRRARFREERSQVGVVANVAYSGLAKSLQQPCRHRRR